MLDHVQLAMVGTATKSVTLAVAALANMSARSSFVSKEREDTVTAAKTHEK